MENGRDGSGAERGGACVLPPAPPFIRNETGDVICEEGTKTNEKATMESDKLAGIVL